MSSNTNEARAGITLLELIIVMVILVTVAGWALPAITRSFSAQKVAKAADLVRAEMNRARILAMRTGEIHGFFYFPDSASFKTAPFNEEMVNVLRESLNRRTDFRPSNFGFGDTELPPGIFFANGETLEDARSAAASQDNPTSTAGMRPILFYPDGSSQSAKLFLRTDESDFVEIRLRGMTGTTSSAPMLTNTPDGR